MLSNDFLEEVAEFIDGKVASGDFTIGGVTYPAKIRRSISNGKTIRKHIYLTQKDPYGTVTRARLLSDSGKVIAERTDPQNHEQGKGLLLEFKITVQEV